MPQETRRLKELRAHHLFSVSDLCFWRAHKSDLAEAFYRKLKAAQFRFMGRGNGREFANHQIDLILDAIANQREIKIVSEHDDVCVKCPQKGDGKCRVMGRDYEASLLQAVDEAVAQNTQGVIEIGKTYPAEYILQNMDAIRRALKQTFLEISEIRKRQKER